jgi:hypothetical protein
MPKMGTTIYFAHLLAQPCAYLRRRVHLDEALGESLREVIFFGLSQQ